MQDRRFPLWLSVLLLLSWLDAAASPAGTVPESPEEGAPRADVPAEGGWPWEKDPELLARREKALARLYSLGVYCLPPAGRSLDVVRLDEKAVQRQAAQMPLRGFATVVGDDEFGYSPDRGTDDLTDEAFLESMKLFPEITSLSLTSTDLTDEAIKAVLTMPHLLSFRLQYLFPPVHPCRITDEGMRTLAQCSTLEELTFLGVTLTDTGVQYLSRLPNLRRIMIEATYVTPNCLADLVNAPRLEEIWIRGNRGVAGTLFYRDISDYDRLCIPITRAAEQEMAMAKGVPRLVRINATLTVDPSVLEALCRTPTVAKIEMDLFANWKSASALAAIEGQEHLQSLSCYHTWNPTADTVRVLEDVKNDSVRLKAPGHVFTVPEWRAWARERIDTAGP